MPKFSPKEIKQYFQNIDNETIDGNCPKCKRVFKVFPEYLEMQGKEAWCSVCSVKLVK